MPTTQYRGHLCQTCRQVKPGTHFSHGKLSGYFCSESCLTKAIKLYIPTQRSA